MTTSSLPQEVDSRFRFGSLVAAGIIVVTFFLMGVAASAFLHSVTPKVFESDAIVLIESRSPPLISNGRLSEEFRVRHEQLIGEDNIVTKVLIKYDLKDLPTLRDLPPNDQILHIQNNLDVQLSRDTDNLYHLRYQSRNARDAQTVLATLVSTYDKHLVEKYRSPNVGMHELLLKMKERFATDLAAKIEKVEQIEKQIAAGQNSDDNKAMLKELQEEVERTQLKLGEAARQIKMLPEEESPRGFNFTTLSPASKGVSIYPRLPVYLLLGGCGGGLVGLVTAGLMVAVLSARN